MNKHLLFTDGSVHVQSKIGWGAFLVLSEEEKTIEELKHRVETKRFENTSSTKLELQTLLWALSEISTEKQKLVIYTDSQNIARLLQRRQRLEQSNFRSKKGELLKNADLYKAFYQTIDLFDCRIIKVKGHQPSRNKDNIEQIFALVDKASRKALRNDN
uniref:ribonuclease HI n=1 Tax=uncultured Draconibacterium sp. TaxID=1573823 RepID=UPI00321702EA